MLCKTFVLKIYIKFHAEVTLGEYKGVKCEKVVYETKDEDIDAEITASTGGMSDMGSLMASGLTISIYGKDMEKMEEIREDIAEIVRGTEGFENVNAGEEVLVVSPIRLELYFNIFSCLLQIFIAINFTFM